TKSGPPPAPAARTAASAAATTAAPAPAAPERPAAPAPRAGNAPAASEPPAAPARQARAENPTVFFRCEGFPHVRHARRSPLREGFQKPNRQPVREPGRAAIVLTGNVDVVQERVSRDFGTPMQTRTYTVAVDGETRDGTPVSMPAPRTFSFDAQYGRE